MGQKRNGKLKRSGKNPAETRARIKRKFNAMFPALKIDRVVGSVMYYGRADNYLLAFTPQTVPSAGLGPYEFRSAFPSLKPTERQWKALVELVR